MVEPTGAIEDDLIELIKKFKDNLTEADSISIQGKENTILCVDLAKDYGKSFRVIPSKLWAVVNKLFISNMEFNEFVSAADPNGVVKGF